MKKYVNYIWAGGISLLFSMTACHSGADEMTDPSDKNVMTFEVLHPDKQSRVTDAGFETNDCVGLYLTTKGTPLELSGNYVNNASLTYSGSAWTSAKPIYWNEGIYDIYAYFPYTKSLSSVDDMPLSVSTEQHVSANYAASDFLWAGKKGVEASDGKITLQFEHKMSRLVIKLTKGEDYEGDLPEDAEVYIHNTVTSATADSVHYREICFPCTASTFKPRIDSHHGGTWDSPVGKPRGKGSWESLEGKPLIP